MDSKINKKVSLFQNAFDKKPKIVELGTIVERIKNSCALQQLCTELRKIKDPEERLFFKRDKLLATTFSGIFHNGHAQRHFKQHSGLIHIDFDGRDFPRTLHLCEIMVLLKNDPYTLIGFLSPSGTGYKLIVQIPCDPSKHILYFLALEKYYNDVYGLRIDPACKDLGRLCFLSYDPLIYLNEEAKVFQFIEQPLSYDYRDIKKHHGNNIYLQVEGVVRQIEVLKIDITDDYSGEWLKLGLALADCLGENGRTFFHRLSIFSKKYNPRIADLQYDKCLKGRKQGITIKSFFWLAKSYGINIYPDYLNKIAQYE